MKVSGPYLITNDPEKMDLCEFIKDAVSRAEQKAKEFLQAAQEGDIDFIQRFMNEYNCLLAANGKGLNGLELASLAGHIDIVKLLIQKSSLGKDRQMIQSSLMNAAFRGHKQVIEFLITFLMSSESKDVSHDCSMALPWAIESNNTEIVKFLLNHGANARTTNKAGVNALTLAKNKGNPHIITLINEALEKKVSEEQSRTQGNYSIIR